MASIPQLAGLDHTIPLLREGYDFLPRRFERLDTDVFETRLGLRKTICLRGGEAARIFYDSARFRRRDAAPRRVRKTLFGEGGVQGLDGAEHRRRKQLFMDLMGPDALDRLVQLVVAHWREAAAEWEAEGRVVLLTASREVLCRAVCAWVGVPLRESEVEERATQLAQLIEAPAALGPAYLRGRIARKRANAWMEEVVEGIRKGRLEAPEESAARAVALHREDGDLLPARVAAVELLNIVRPTVAIDRYIAFAALALHRHGSGLQEVEPAWDWEDDRDVEAFVQEVRRYYPFFPFVGARVRESFEWRGYGFEKGRLVLLDLYGTNHDGAIWRDPHQFRPERFRGRDIDAFSLVPQGGGDHHGNHRCAGEWATIAIMAAVVKLLVREHRYRVPEQDLSVDHARIPARPESGFVIEPTGSSN